MDKEIRPGTVITEYVNLEALDHRTAERIPSPVLEERGGPLSMAGVTSKLAIKIRRMNLKGGGNQNTARWRRRHGGAWVSPANSKFKGTK